MNDGDPPLGGVGTSCTTSRKYMMFGLGLGQKKKNWTYHLKSQKVCVNFDKWQKAKNWHVNLHILHFLAHQPVYI